MFAQKSICVLPTLQTSSGLPSTSCRFCYYLFTQTRHHCVSLSASTRKVHMEMDKMAAVCHSGNRVTTVEEHGMYLNSKWLRSCLCPRAGKFSHKTFCLQNNHVELLRSPPFQLVMRNLGWQQSSSVFWWFQGLISGRPSTDFDNR